MTTNAGVGTSRDHNPNIAGREAAEQALQKAGVDRPDFVFMFASIGYDQHSLLRAVRETTGEAPLTGCSAEGTINGDSTDESNFSVLVTVISSEELHWRNGLESGLEADPHAVGQRVAQALLPDLSADTIGLFVFPVLTGNLEHFFAGLEGDLSIDRFLPLWGGGAGNNLELAPIGSASECKTDTDARSFGEFSKLPESKEPTPCPHSNHTLSNPYGSSSESSRPSEKQTIRLTVTVPASPTGWSSRSWSRSWCSAALTGG